LADRGHRSCHITTLHSQLILVHGSTTRAEQTRPGARGANNQFGSRSEGTGSPRNRCVGTVRLRVELWLQATSITSIHTAVSGYSSSNMRTPKACAPTTTTCTNNRPSGQLIAKASGDQFEKQSWLKFHSLDGAKNRCLPKPHPTTGHLEKVLRLSAAVVTAKPNRL
jgi:hypothetical protein